jgi:hypothetical protein
MMIHFVLLLLGMFEIGELSGRGKVFVNILMNEEANTLSFDDLQKAKDIIMKSDSVHKEEAVLVVNEYLQYRTSPGFLGEDTSAETMTTDEEEFGG